MYIPQSRLLDDHRTLIDVARFGLGLRLGFLRGLVLVLGAAGNDVRGRENEHDAEHFPKHVESFHIGDPRRRTIVVGANR